MSSRTRELISCERGATAIEYSLIAGAVALVIIGAVALLGADLGAFFQEFADSI